MKTLKFGDDELAIPLTREGHALIGQYLKEKPMESLELIRQVDAAIFENKWALMAAGFQPLEFNFNRPWKRTDLADHLDNEEAPEEAAIRVKDGSGLWRMILLKDKKVIVYCVEDDDGRETTRSYGNVAYEDLGNNLVPLYQVL